ncbi:hypothetical protein D3C80_1524320 [compost metagenome]
MVVQHFPGKVVGGIQHQIRPPRPQPGRDKDIEITHDRGQPLEIDLVVILQQQPQVLPRREGITGQIQESVERFRAADIQAIAFQRQPEHADNAEHPGGYQHPQRDPAAHNADKQE